MVSPSTKSKKIITLINFSTCYEGNFVISYLIINYIRYLNHKIIFLFTKRIIELKQTYFYKYQSIYKVYGILFFIKIVQSMSKT